MWNVEECSPQRCHALISRTCKDVASRGKRDFADEIKLKSRDGESFRGYSVGPCKRKREAGVSVRATQLERLDQPFLAWKVGQGEPRAKDADRF